ncbi:MULTISPECIES: N,N-dimethylformamidase beta subunit family domain-containing protein [Mesorhizobium]|uniref:N,N-dimethylformamidase beta subunit family domain-containing protein n=1 Tax=Mesorhizobium TaxID=68287 RepID=UPI0010A97009|nr:MULTISPECIES: N,N-dimethylformamidase beta subunit family domain-containing protein [Mesorhizobium]
MLQIAGYTDQWVVSPGEKVGVRVSSRHPSFYARLVCHLGAIETSQHWSSKTVEINEARSGPYPAVERPLKLGSFFSSDVTHQLNEAALVLVFDLFPTCFGTDGGTVVTIGFEQWHLSLRHDPSGVLFVAAGNPDAQEIRKFDGLKLHLLRWQRIAVRLDPSNGVLDASVDGSSAQSETVRLGGAPHSTFLTGFALAGRSTADGIRGDFDGKIASPSLFGTVRTLAQVLVSPETSERIARWNFGSFEQGPFSAPDEWGNCQPGQFLNSPTRAVTSSSWDGRNNDFRDFGSQYDAVWFHRDDLGDAGWPVDFELTVPASAVGACSIILSAFRDVDWTDRASFDAVPLFVPPSSTSSSRVALVLPTFSYRAYTNNTFAEEADPKVFQRKKTSVSKPLYDYAIDHGLKSLYSLHSDGSGVCLASLKRPQVTTRADFDSQLQGFPHQFSADLAIVGWLHDLNIDFDILTDEMLHDGGHSVLAPYDVILTGSHPEYASASLLDAYEDFAATGGSIMYLGGNGFYWSIGLNADVPELIEVRRAEGGRTWSTGQGERRQQLDGREGGIWRGLGRAPNRLFGIGYCAHGFSGDGTYKVETSLKPESLPRYLAAAFRKIGDRPFGVAGLELDRYAPELGSRADAIVLARAESMPPGYVPTVEEFADLDVLIVDPRAALHAMVRGDMVLFRHDGGGQIFSVGSIRWTNGLLDPNDEMQVASVTEAALRDLLADAAFRRGMVSAEGWAAC